MKLSNFIKGLEVLSKHFKSADVYAIAAEHDQFFVFVTDTPLSDDEFGIMTNLGWFQPEAKSQGEYDPNEGWSAYV